MNNQIPQSVYACVVVVALFTAGVVLLDPGFRRGVRMAWLRRFPRYRRLELKFAPYGQAEILIRANLGKPESERWQIARPEEDLNRMIGYVYLERLERIFE